MRSHRLSAASAIVLTEHRTLVGAWTVNDEETMLDMLSLRVERLYTDYPRRLRPLRERREAVGRGPDALRSCTFLS